MDYNLLLYFLAVTLVFFAHVNEWHKVEYAALGNPIDLLLPSPYGMSFWTKVGKLTLLYIVYCVPIVNVLLIIWAGVLSIWLNREKL